MILFEESVTESQAKVTLTTYGCEEHPGSSYFMTFSRDGGNLFFDYIGSDEIDYTEDEIKNSVEGLHSLPKTGLNMHIGHSERSEEEALKIVELLKSQWSVGVDYNP